jgi:hypothetical protein
LRDESIFTFTRGCADVRDPTAVFRLKGERTLTLLIIVAISDFQNNRAMVR